METAVFLPDCKHHACKDCLIDFLGTLEEKGEEPHCPVCKSGPYSDAQVDKILNSAGGETGSQRPKGYTVTPSSPSSGGDVLTIDDSSEDEAPRPRRGGKRAKLELSADSDSDSDDEAAVRSAKEVEARAKAKVVPKVAPVETVELEEEDESEHDLAAVKAGDEDKDFKMGDVNDTDSDDEAVAEAKPRTRAIILDKDFKSSTKLDALVASLKKAREEDPKLKVVIFSRESVLLPSHPLSTPR